MTKNDTPPLEEIDSQATANAVRAALRFINVLRHRKFYVLCSICVALALGGLYYLATPPTYEAKAQVLITFIGNDVLKPGASSEGNRQALIPTYVQLLSSEVVLEGAIAQLETLSPEMRIDFAGQRRERWPDVLRENLSAQAVRLTKIVQIRYRSKSPHAAEAVVSAVVASYMQFMQQNHQKVSAHIVEILERNRTTLRTEMDQKQTQLMTLQRQVKDLGQQNSQSFVHPAVQRVIGINDALLVAQQERMKLEVSLAGIGDAIRAGGDLRQHLVALEPIVGRELILNALGMTPQDTDFINDLKQQRRTDVGELKRLREHYGENNYRVQDVVRRLRETDEYLANYQQDLKNRFSSLNQVQLAPMLKQMVEEKLASAWEHENKLVNEYKLAETEAVQLQDELARLGLLEHDLSRLRKLHDEIHNRVSNIDFANGENDVRVAKLSKPKASPKPVSPKLLLITLCSVFGGFGVGAVFVYIIDVLDDRFRSPEEMQDQLRVSMLAMVRHLATGEEHGADALQVHVKPLSVESEAFRTLRTTLAFMPDDMECVAVTSSEPGDGKTTIISNLAASFAQANKRTLLIDADLRRPGLSKLFTLRNNPGASDVLRGSDDVGVMARERIENTGIENLDVLPCGPKAANPAELLASTRMSELLVWAQNEYDQVLVDCPPALAASDAAVVGRLADGMLLVVHPSKNHRRLVTRAVEGLNGMDVNLVGLVANRVDSMKDTEYYGYGSGYGYGYGYGYGNGYGSEESEEGQLEDVTDDRTETLAPRRRAA